MCEYRLLRTLSVAATFARAVTQPKTPREHMSEPHGGPVTRHDFWHHLRSQALRASLLVIGSLVGGTLGFHSFSRQPWVDSLLNASMLLGGMGPVGDLGPTPGKLFAAAYALYSGLIFLIVAGLLVTPVFHRVLHRFHVEGKGQG
jgi:hypothetical protein